MQGQVHDVASSPPGAGGYTPVDHGASHPNQSPVPQDRLSPGDPATGTIYQAASTDGSYFYSDAPEAPTLNAGELTPSYPASAPQAPFLNAGQGPGLSPYGTSPVAKDQAQEQHRQLLVTPSSRSSSTLPGRRRWIAELSLWAWELVAIVLFLCMMVAIPATLRPFDGRPLPQLPLLISLNSLLAVYAVVLKAALVFVAGACVAQLQWSWFASPVSARGGQDVGRPLIDLVRADAAARGPWGAVRWLWANHVREPLMAFAALVMILLIAVEPFVQQLVGFEDCSTVLVDLQAPISGDGASLPVQTVSSPATLPRTNYFRPPGLHLGPLSQSIMPDVQSLVQTAVVTGLFAPGSNALIQATCSTGNCTFPSIYHTVGYCSKCEDISESLAISSVCFNQSTLRPFNSTFTKNGTVCPPGQSSYNITTSVPGGLSLTFSPYVQYWPTKLFGMDAFAVGGGTYPAQVQVVVAKQTPDWDSSGKVRQDPFTGANITGCNDPAKATTWSCRGYGAASCTLQPCVRSYSAVVEAGVLKETLVDSSDPLLDWGLGLSSPNVSGAGSLTRALLDTQCTTEAENTALTKLGYLVDPSNKRWLPYNLTFNASLLYPESAPFPQSLAAHGCLYLISSGFVTALWDSFLALPDVGLLVGTVGGRNGITLFIGVEGPQTLQRIYDYGHAELSTVSKAFDQVAEALTSYIRTNGEVNSSTPVEGLVLHYATCLRVNWGWIALPAVLVAATGSLFLGTMLASWIGRRTTVPPSGKVASGASMRGVPVWKSNPLALLFHGPAGAAWHGVSRHWAGDQEAKWLNSEKGMEEEARKLRVRLEAETGDGHAGKLVMLSVVDVGQRSAPQASKRSWRTKRSGSM